MNSIPVSGASRSSFDIVLICDYDYDNPFLRILLQRLTRRIASLTRNGDELAIRSVQPWNSVKVTIKLSRESAQKLRQLTENARHQLRRIGVLNIRIGDETITLNIGRSRGGHAKASRVGGLRGYSPQISPVPSSALGSFPLPAGGTVSPEAAAELASSLSVEIDNGGQVMSDASGDISLIRRILSSSGASNGSNETNSLEGRLMPPPPIPGAAHRAAKTKRKHNNNNNNNSTTTPLSPNSLRRRYSSSIDAVIADACGGGGDDRNEITSITEISETVASPNSSTSDPPVTLQPDDSAPVESDIVSDKNKTGEEQSPEVPHNMHAVSEEKDEEEEIKKPKLTAVICNVGGKYVIKSPERLPSTNPSSSDRSSSSSSTSSCASSSLITSACSSSVTSSASSPLHCEVIVSCSTTSSSACCSSTSPVASKSLSPKVGESSNPYTDKDDQFSCQNESESELNTSTCSSSSDLPITVTACDIVQADNPVCSSVTVTAKAGTPAPSQPLRIQTRSSSIASAAALATVSASNNSAVVASLTSSLFSPTRTVNSAPASSATAKANLTLSSALTANHQSGSDRRLRSKARNTSGSSQPSSCTNTTVIELKPPVTIPVIATSSTGSSSIASTAGPALSTASPPSTALRTRRQHRLAEEAVCSSVYSSDDDFLLLKPLSDRVVTATLQISDDSCLVVSPASVSEPDLRFYDDFSAVEMGDDISRRITTILLNDVPDEVHNHTVDEDLGVGAKRTESCFMPEALSHDSAEGAAVISVHANEDTKTGSLESELTGKLFDSELMDVDSAEELVTPVVESKDSSDPDVEIVIGEALDRLTSDDIPQFAAWSMSSLTQVEHWGQESIEILHDDTKTETLSSCLVQSSPSLEAVQISSPVSVVEAESVETVTTTVKMIVEDEPLETIFKTEDLTAAEHAVKSGSVPEYMADLLCSVAAGNSPGCSVPTFNADTAESLGAIKMDEGPTSVEPDTSVACPVEILTKDIPLVKSKVSIMKPLLDRSDNVSSGMEHASVDAVVRNIQGSIMHHKAGKKVDGQKVNDPQPSESESDVASPQKLAPSFSKSTCPLSKSPFTTSKASDLTGSITVSSSTLTSVSVQPHKTKKKTATIAPFTASTHTLRDSLAQGSRNSAANKHSGVTVASLSSSPRPSFGIDAILNNPSVVAAASLSGSTASAAQSVSASSTTLLNSAATSSNVPVTSHCTTALLNELTARAAAQQQLLASPHLSLQAAALGLSDQLRAEILRNAHVDPLLLAVNPLVQTSTILNPLLTLQHLGLEAALRTNSSITPAALFGPATASLIKPVPTVPAAASPFSVFSAAAPQGTLFNSALLSQTGPASVPTSVGDRRNFTGTSPGAESSISQTARTLPKLSDNLTKVSTSTNIHGGADNHTRSSSDAPLRTSFSSSQPANANAPNCTSNTQLSGFPNKRFPSPNEPDANTKLSGDNPPTIQAPTSVKSNLELLSEIASQMSTITTSKRDKTSPRLITSSKITADSSSVSASQRTTDSPDHRGQRSASVIAPLKKKILDDYHRHMQADQPNNSSSLHSGSPLIYSSTSTVASQETFQASLPNSNAPGKKKRKRPKDSSQDLKQKSAKKSRSSNDVKPKVRKPITTNTVDDSIFDFLDQPSSPTPTPSNEPTPEVTAQLRDINYKCESLQLDMSTDHVIQSKTRSGLIVSSQLKKDSSASSSKNEQRRNTLVKSLGRKTANSSRDDARKLSQPSSKSLPKTKQASVVLSPLDSSSDMVSGAKQLSERRSDDSSGTRKDNTAPRRSKNTFRKKHVEK